MNQAINLINQRQVDTKLLSFLEIDKLEVLDELEVLFLFLLVKGVGVGEEGHAEEEVQEVTAFGHVLLDVLDALVEKFESMVMRIMYY